VPLADSDALRRVYRVHVRAVYAFFAYSVSESNAEDLTSQTFERVIANWGRFDASRASERTWILAIARNLLTDHYRRESLRHTVSTDEHPALVEALHESRHPLASRIELEGFAQWISVLGERDRVVLAMRYAGDASTEEIAQELDLTVSNVHQIISRSLRRLRDLSADRVPPRTP
jgi:RNA polymerase sigma factor (sigma-70 family)